MESYQSFLDRINSFEKSEVDFGNEYFKGNPSIAQKVDKNNKFQTFYGDTIVFNLDEVTKKKLSELVESLYSIVPECFCERLVSNTFHMTLHDLSNSPVLQKIAAEVFENELNVIEKAKQIHVKKIKMRSKYIFNMVNTSLVLNELYYQKFLSMNEYINIVNLGKV